MRKSIVSAGELDRMAPAEEWLDLERTARVEVSSEAPDHPVEAALIPVRGVEWRAGSPGVQTVRLLFDEPRQIRRVWLRFVEPNAARTQEFVLRWAPADGQPMREVVRQQWTFSPGGSVQEVEDYRADLSGVAVFELTITPDISGGDARASLAELRVG